MQLMGNLLPSGLNKSFSDAAHGQFVSILKWIAWKLGKRVIRLTLGEPLSIAIIASIKHQKHCQTAGMIAPVVEYQCSATITVPYLSKKWGWALRHSKMPLRERSL